MSRNNNLLECFQMILAGHAELRAREAARLNRVLTPLLDGFLTARGTWTTQQRKTADEFNLFRVLRLENAEVRHSGLLAWLLDHNIEQGTHAQGELGFRLFLEEMEPELRQQCDQPVASYAAEPYWVKTEVSGDEARVDVEIAAHGRFLIHIENKIWSPEGDDQTNREWRDMQRRARELGVPGKCCHALYLTLGGDRARSEYFKPVAWHRIARVLERFAEQAQPPEVKLFARHYAKAVRSLSPVDLETEEEDHADLQRT